MGRALADLKSEMLLAAQEGGSTIGHTKQDDDMEDRRRKDKEMIQVSNRVQIVLAAPGN